MRRLTAILLFLVLANDKSTAAFYDQYIPAPFAWVQGTLLDPIASLRPFDVIMGIMLIIAAAKGGKRPPLVKPVKTALFIQAGAIFFWVAYGVWTGGDAHSAAWQVYLILASVVLAFELATVFQTPEDFTDIGKAIVYAALYHALMCIWFYRTKWKMIWPTPEYVTCHDDTVLWVTGVLVLLANAIQKRSSKTWMLTIAGVVFIVLAIQFNNRRLAWVSLIMGLMELFVLIPPGPVRRKAIRLIMYMVPILLLYVAVGWGQTGGIFAPLKSFQTVSVEEDSSTKARNMENLGLIATGNASSMFMGAGWGHGYIEVSNKYAIYAFELWPFVPHNSILGLLAFTGAFGFLAFWLAFPTSMFLNARMARLATNPTARTIGLVGASQMLVCANQMFGDMGDFSYRTMYVLAISYAVAMRLPPITGAWPDGSPTATMKMRSTMKKKAK